MSPIAKKRADILLVEQGLAESRSVAQRLVADGQVRLGQRVLAKPSTLLPPDSALQVIAPPRYVSRGGLKLEAALEAFALPVQGRVCADVGASTGGFTDCLLQHGAQKVYAIDVGRDQLHRQLRRDPRVVVMEQTNARYVAALPEPIDLVSIDASFISLDRLLPVVAGWLAPAGEVVALVKPQFEAGRQAVKRGKGVIRDAEVHRRVLLGVLQSAAQSGLPARGLIVSPVRGPKGNIEFLLHLSGQKGMDAPAPELVHSALEEARVLAENEE